MIEIEHRWIDNIPLLEMVDTTLKNEQLPTVVFYHGWSNVKESVLVNGYELAKRGIRAILPEALFHGERKDEKETEDHYFDFWKIVLTNIKEYSVLMNRLIQEGKTDPDRLGVTGLSMGGITICGIFATYPNVKSADCLMGSPNMEQFAGGIAQKVVDEGGHLPESASEQIHQLAVTDLSQQPEKIAGRPFHFWHGTEDDTVPFQPTYDFYSTVKDKEYGRNTSFTITKDGHKVPYKISVEMADFFKKNL